MAQDLDYMKAVVLNWKVSEILKQQLDFIVSLKKDLISMKCCLGMLYKWLDGLEEEFLQKHDSRKDLFNYSFPLINCDSSRGQSMDQLRFSRMYNDNSSVKKQPEMAILQSLEVAPSRNPKNKTVTFEPPSHDSQSDLLTSIPATLRTIKHSTVDGRELAERDQNVMPVKRRTIFGQRELRDWMDFDNEEEVKEAVVA
mmetsp:Transcript_12964/g.12836  ORF Transcript_12964/g.12836 Transcript_12964/m.12836 type:complete len:198 (+) Transcript_12964:296-889(+)